VLVAGYASRTALAPVSFDLSSRLHLEQLRAHTHASMAECLTLSFNRINFAMSLTLALARLVVRASFDPQWRVGASHWLEYN
jgi:hypothetical protein